MHRVLSTLTLVILMLGLSAAPSSAKGPTHMLLVAPLSGNSVFMELEDSRFRQVERLLDDLGDEVTEPVFERWHEVQVTQTMYALDIFRADIVFVDGEGRAVVMTVRSHLEGPGHATDWREVRDGGALTALFGEMGLLGGKGPASETGDPGAEPEAPADTTATSASPPVTEAAGSSAEGNGWRWALPALLVGLLLGVLGTGLVHRRSGQVVAQRLARS